MVRLRAFIVVILIVMFVLASMPTAVFSTTDVIGGTNNTSAASANFAVAFAITLSASGTVQSIGINWAGTQAGNVRVALYSAGSGKPGNLLTQSASTPLTTSTGWQDVSVTTFSATTGSYWVAFILSSSKTYFYNSGGSRSYYSKTFGAFDATWGSSSTQDSVATANMRVTYTSGPDFSITATPSSQNIAAGSSASFTLNLAASGGFTGTVNLSVTSGCPSGVTCTLNPTSVSSFPNTATLTVPTLITTTGSYNVVVTASNGTITHTVTATVSVTAPNSYPFQVRPGATQIVITVSWTGTATASVTIAGPGGSPTLSESAGVIYDRTSISVSGGTPTTSYIHRVTFAITGPTSQETWTLLLSISGTSNYNVAIEVS